MRLKKIPTHKDKRVNNVNNELISGCSAIKDGVTKPVKKCNVVASVEKQVMSRGCLFPSLMKKTQVLCL